MEANNPFVALSEYEVRNLTAHLEEAGRGQELHHLLQLEVPPAKEEPPVRNGLQRRFARLFGRDQPGPRLPGRNAWYSLKDELGDLDGYLSDVARGWRLAEQESARGVAHGEQVASIGLEVRYALMKSSLSSVASNILPSFVLALVKNEVWSLPEAVAYTRSIPDLWQRVQTLACLVPSAPEPLRAEIISEGLNLLFELNTPGDDREERGREDESDFGPLEAFVAWTPYLPEAMLPQALAAARNLRGSVTSMAAAERAQALAALAAHLTADAREAVLGEALEQAREDPTAAALKAIAPLAPAAAFLEILGMARSIKHPFPRVEALAAVIAYAPPDLQADLIQEALTAAQAFDNVEWRVEALTSLAPCVPESVCRETVELARTLTWDEARVEALAKLVPFLSEPLKTQVRAQALAEARAMVDSGMVEALAMVIPLLPEQEQVMVLREALTTVQRASYGVGAGVKGIILWPLAPLLPKPLLQEALVMAKGVDIEAADLLAFRALAALATYSPIALTEERVSRAFATTLAMESDANKTEAFIALAPYLPEELLRQALLAVQKLNPDAMYETLEGLAPYVPRSLEKLAVSVWRKTGRYSNLLTMLVPGFSEWHIGWAFGWWLWSADHNPDLLAALAPRLRPFNLQRALRKAQALEDQSKRYRLLIALLPSLPEPQRSEVLEEALKIVQASENQSERYWSLAALLPSLPEPQRSEVLEAEANAVLTSEMDETNFCYWLEELGSWLGEQVLLKSLRRARGFTDVNARGKALTLLVRNLPEERRGEVLEEAFVEVRAIKEQKELSWILVTLAPYLSGALLQEAIAIALRIHFPASQRGILNWADVLAALVPSLPEEVREEVLSDALTRAFHSELKSSSLDFADSDDRSLRALARPVATLSRSSLHRVWQREWMTFRQEAWVRADIVSALDALAPIIASLGGSSAVSECISALVEVRAWWP